MSVTALDRERLRQLFDLRSSYNLHSGGDYTDDPYPVWRELRERAPVHPGIVHELTGYPRAAMFQGLPYPDRPHFSVFTYVGCDSAYRDGEVFASSPHTVDPTGDGIGVESSMLSMGGTQHRRYRALAKMISKFNVPPFVVVKNEHRDTQPDWNVLLEFVKNEGKKDCSVQRYKGLGEMNAEQLAETTMNPEKRTLLQVRLEDAVLSEEIFSTLMGEDVESRRKFIEENALDVKNLDV